MFLDESHPMPPNLKLVEEEESTTEEVLSLLKSEDEDFDFSSLPTPPEHLGLEGQVMWWKLAKELNDKGRLNESIKNLLESYCMLKENALEFSKIIQTDGKIINGRAHPAYKMMLDALSASKHIAAEIGFVRKETLNLKEDKDSEWGDKSLLA